MPTYSIIFALKKIENILKKHYFFLDNVFREEYKVFNLWDEVGINGNKVVLI